METRAQTVEFFFAIGSRYSYLASTQIAALERDTGARVEWRPITLPDLMTARGRTPFAPDPVSGQPVSGQYDMTYRRIDAERWARLYGVPYRDANPRAIGVRTHALACLAAKRQGALVLFAHRLFAAIYADGMAPGPEDCAAIAAAMGLDAAAFTRAMADPAITAEHDATVTDAFARGVFGVPTFIAGDAMFWGNDRLVLLRDHLLSAAVGRA
ncbi:MAG: DsbA family protein [Alphaproteobacteria bacterium]